MPNDAGAAVARKPTAFELELADYEPQLVAALPGHISVDRFKRTVVTAINQNPDLARADRRSLFTACVRAAQDGLLPDGRDAALVVYNTKNKKTGQFDKLVQYLPMVQGIIRRMRNSGELASIVAYVVHEKDEFVYQLGDDPKIVHNPALLDRGKPIGVYAVARLTNGEVQREVMSVADVEKVRAVSRSKDKGPWVDWWEEMARKTVIRRLSKRLPNSSDIDEMMRREDEQYFTGEDRSEARVAVARPTRAGYGVGPIIDAENTAGEREEDQADLYPLVTLDGEEQLIEDANQAGAALCKLIEEAHQQRGEDGVHGVWESNAMLISLLREKGHNKLADELNGFCAEWLDKRAVPKDTAPSEAMLSADETDKAMGSK